MDDKVVNRNTIRKRKSRKVETSEQRKTRLGKQREKYHQRKAMETIDQKDARRANDRKRKRLKLGTEMDGDNATELNKLEETLI